MKEPKLKTSKSGRRTLYVYYAGNGFDEAIKKAERLYNVQNDMTVTIIALPVKVIRFRRFPPDRVVVGN